MKTSMLHINNATFLYAVLHYNEFDMQQSQKNLF